MIYYSMPFNTEKNIGKYYNSFMSLLPDGAWGCFVDGDATFTTYDYGFVIEKAIKENPSYSCFTCYTNRIGCPWQIAPNVDKVSNDIEYHRKFGASLKDAYGSTTIDVTSNVPPFLQAFSGFFILLKKSAWLGVNKFKEEKMLSVDVDMHEKLTRNGYRTGLIQGLYLYHWYRGGDMSNISHLV